ncbi:MULTISPECIES: agmatinase [Thermofilum]|uniref:Agmatinase n=2 Tax=Thermofilum adornatum TaxID=1365176 RepID=S5Z723_9CREN|nr:agmatinase [Thermofilum adornatum]AGT35115.1 hypothetical protein N186_03770 [Thermofilum adornatum]AJB42826.1 Agmatinase [Thermofilum adornatum 1505]
MSFRELYMHHVSPTLFGVNGDYDSARIVVMGIPFDSAATGVPGARYAPRRIREVSVELETFHPATGLDVEFANVFDAGDLPLVTCVDSLVRVVGRVVEEVYDSGKRIISLGGDHFVSYPVISTVARKTGRLGVLVFDAHMDLRDEYPFDCRYSHATVFRRLLEENSNIEVAYFRPRGWSKEEYLYAKETKRVQVLGDEAEVDDWFRRAENVYVTIDIDAVDPSFAPGTGTPEPFGLHPDTVRKIIEETFPRYSQKIRGLDIVEVNPLVDVNDVTSRLAAKLLMYALVGLLPYLG